MSINKSHIYPASINQSVPEYKMARNMYHILNDTDDEDNELELKPEIKPEIKPEPKPEPIPEPKPEKKLEEDVIGNGSDLLFKRSYKILVHANDNKDWSIKGYDSNFYTINSVSSYLQFFNNIHKFNLQTNTFFILRELGNGQFVEPMWEHEMNRNGCICSLSIEAQYGLELLEQICMLLVNECLLPDMDILNLVSFSRKNNWTLIKLWSSKKNIDLGKLLPCNVINTYLALSIKTINNDSNKDYNKFG